MSESEEEWTTVRRRRGARSGVLKQLKALPIPVVPLAFDALAEPEERPAQDQSKAKKKKKGKKAKGHDADDDEEGDEQTAGAPGGKTASGGALKAASAKGPAAASKAAQLSFFSWLLSRLVAVLVMLGLMRAAGGAKKKRKSKASAQREEAPAAPAATKPEVVKAADARDKAPAAGAPAKAAAAATAAAPQQQKPVAIAAAAAAAAVAPVTPAKKQDATPAAAAVTPKPVAAATATAPSTPGPAATTAAAAATPLPGSVSKPVQTAAPPPSPPAPATPRVPPPPAIKYDADWGRGKFVVQSLPGSHADVVSAVALAGDVAASAGYDGAVKLWHWPAPGSAGGGVAPRLTLGRALVGHSGRVEAMSAHAESRRLVSSGRDSALKVWDLGSEPGGASAGELASTYVYESVRSLAVDWAGEEATAAGRVLLGARSGTVVLYSLGAGGGARKLAALRGHGDEVTALRFLGGDGSSGSQAASGSRDGSVRLWDLRAAGSGGGGAATAVLTGLSGRVCSLAPLGSHHLVAGDCSSTVKLWDLRMVPSGPRQPPPPAPRRLPNAPGFAGDCCPTAGLWYGTRSSVLLSSSIAWWTGNKQALEEAPPSAKLPMACLNVSAVGATPPAAASASSDATHALMCQYQYTLRLGPGVVTCMAGSADEASMLVGGASGSLWAMRLVRGGSAAAAAAERAAAAAAGAEGGCEVVDALVVGADEFSDDEYDDEEDEDEE